MYMAYTYEWADSNHIDQVISLCSYDLAVIGSANHNQSQKIIDLFLHSSIDCIDIGNPAENDDDYEVFKSVIESSSKDNCESVVCSCIQLNVTTSNHSIRKTFEMARQLNSSIIMLDVSTIYNKETILTALHLMKKLAILSETEIMLGIRIRYVNADIIEEVVSSWQPSESFKIVISILDSQTNNLPNIYACNIENLKKDLLGMNVPRNSLILSVRPKESGHYKFMNALFGVLAGADRVEGVTIFNSSGVHTDLLELDMNLSDINGYNQRLVPKLFESMREEANCDNSDAVGILKNQFGLNIPLQMQLDVRDYFQQVFSEIGDVSEPIEVFNMFKQHYTENKGVFKLAKIGFQSASSGIVSDIVIDNASVKTSVTATGTGRLDAVINAIKVYFGISFKLSVYNEQLLSSGSSSKAITYIGLCCKGNMYWGVGIEEDLLLSAMDALVTAVNRINHVSDNQTMIDDRLNDILGYIQKNYRTVSLDELSEKFYLSKEYISKYIKRKSGMTFSETLRNIRLKKAKALLKNRDMTIESIAVAIGYQNAENFIRHFKKKYNVTPSQYRSEAGI